MDERVKKGMELFPDLDEYEMADIFAYCDNMRESMDVFGLRPYIAEVFDMPKSEAGVYLEAWMKTYV